MQRMQHVMHHVTARRRDRWRQFSVAEVDCISRSEEDEGYRSCHVLWDKTKGFLNKRVPQTVPVLQLPGCM